MKVCCFAADVREMRRAAQRYCPMHLPLQTSDVHESQPLGAAASCGMQRSEAKARLAAAPTHRLVLKAPSAQRARMREIWSHAACTNVRQPIFGSSPHCLLQCRPHADEVSIATGLTSTGA